MIRHQGNGTGRDLQHVLSVEQYLKLVQMWTMFRIYVQLGIHNNWVLLQAQLATQPPELPPREQPEGQAAVGSNCHAKYGFVSFVKTSAINLD